MKDDTTNNDEGSAKPNNNYTSAHTQRLQILAHLRVNPLNTFQLRHRNHMSPAPRIFELRAMGYDIKTTLEDVKDSDGILHKGVATYTLESEPAAANDDEIEGAA